MLIDEGGWHQFFAHSRVTNEFVRSRVNEASLLGRLQSSNAKLDAWFGRKGNPKVIVATGFIAKNPAGQVRRMQMPSEFEVLFSALA
jgi:hypothetical protein